MAIYVAIYNSASAASKESPKEMQRQKNREYAQRSYALKGAKKKQKQEAKARMKRQYMDDEGRKQHNANTAARVRKSRDKMANEKRIDQRKYLESYHLWREHMSNEERDAIRTEDWLQKSNAKDDNKLVGHEDGARQRG